MTKALCLNALAVMDGTAKPSADLTRAIKSVGAESFHRNWVDAMSAAGWRCGGGGKTDHTILMTPHMRRWSLLVDAQRKPLIEAGQATIQATFAEGDDE